MTPEKLGLIFAPAFYDGTVELETVGLLLSEMITEFEAVFEASSELAREADRAAQEQQSAGIETTAARTAKLLKGDLDESSTKFVPLRTTVEPQVYNAVCMHRERLAVHVQEQETVIADLRARLSSALSGATKGDSIDNTSDAISATFAMVKDLADRHRVEQGMWRKEVCLLVVVVVVGGVLAISVSHELTLSPPPLPTTHPTQADGLRAALMHERSKESQTFDWISKKMNASLKVLETLSADVNTRVRKANKDAAKEISDLSTVARRVRVARVAALERIDAHGAGEGKRGPADQALASAQIYKSEFEQLFEVFNASETCTKLRNASKLYETLAS